MDGVQTRNLIGGDWVSSHDGVELEVRNPATDAVLARVPWGGAVEAKQAIDAAAAAFPGWADRVAGDRAKILRRFADLMLRDQERLAQVLTAEQGKPLAESRGEIAYAASFLEWAGEEARRVYGDLVPSSATDKRILVLRQPVGVTAAITPWNFPAAMITRKLGPALAAGCTMVVKPAEQTPLTAIALAALGLEAGLPPGAFNVITGAPAAIGEVLLNDFRMRKLSFTGSTEVGRLLMRGGANNLVRLSLELGGHAPFLVFDDADLDLAVAGALASKFRNMGQTCICPNRFYVQEGVYAEFVSRLAAAVDRLVVGPGDRPGSQVGPLIDDAAVEKVKDHLSDALDRGAALRTGGRFVDVGPGYTRRFCTPAIVEGFTDEMKLSVEETFGPVAPVRRFRTEDEAVELANRSVYGLAAYFFTRDAGRLMRVAERLEYGIVGANDGAPSTAQAPFGGMKHSGYGREGGKYAMDAYLETKYVSWKL